jgi:hypothetical protein
MWNMEAMVRKLWQGKYPLIVAFWGFYVIGYLISFGLVMRVSPLFETQPWRFLSVMILIVPYNIISTVGVWRSAKAYPFTRWWPVWAQICVGVWEVRVSWSILTAIERGITEMG